MHRIPNLKYDLPNLKQNVKIGSDTNFTTPIEDFGTKIMNGLGWKQGFGIGRDKAKVSQAIEYIPR